MTPTPDLRALVERTAAEVLPRLIGDLEAARAAAWARLTAPRPEPMPAAPVPEDMLTPAPAAEAPARGPAA